MAKEKCKIKRIVGAKDSKGGGKRWDTLTHNGVYFPDPYKPLPKNIKIKYEGKPVSLDTTDFENPFNICAEESAVFFAMKLEQDLRLEEKRAEKGTVLDDDVFITNFFSDWKKILKKSEIKDFKKLDFTPITKFLRERSEQKKQQKKEMTKEEKEQEKKQKLRLKDLYGYAMIDGKRIAIGNYTIQPPGLFMGHGKAPLRGKIKKRIQPSDITLNVSKNHIPKCENHGLPCKWRGVVENKNVTWIAEWKNPITNHNTYVWLSRNESHWVCDDDKKKFDKARELKKNISKIRKLYTEDMKSSDGTKRQLATAVYLLDELAIRPGVEKDEEKEAGTQGLTTLTTSNVKFLGDNKIEIDFTGKSSIRFKKEITVSPIVYKNLTLLAKNKGKLFPKVDATSLNEYLKTLLPSITSKVFRTFKASSILQEQLDKLDISEDDTDTNKKLAYDKANLEAAIQLNHKRMSENKEKIDKIKTKIKDYKQKKKEAKTDKQKETAQKNMDIWEMKLLEAENNVALSTSKVNYIDPRIACSWAKRTETPIEKIYNKTQLQKFIWAMPIELEWKF